MVYKCKMVQKKSKMPKKKKLIDTATQLKASEKEAEMLAHLI